jgi:hypothetical protein
MEPGDGGELMFVPSSPTSLRPANQNPYAVNYTDCTEGPAAEGLYLSFKKLILENFAGSPDSAQVWVSVGDQGCEHDEQRGSGGACWPALRDQDKHPGANPSFLSNPISVQDIIGPQHTPYAPMPPMPGPRPYSKQTADACGTQCTYTHEVFFLYFLPITSTGTFDPSGAYYKYQLDVDLVGPPPPTLLPANVGDTLLVANWNPNTDSETAGYNIYIDPFPGTEGPSPAVCGASTRQPAPDAASTSGGSGTGNACYDQNLVEPVPHVPGEICAAPQGSSVDASTDDASGNDGGDAGDAGDGGATADADAGDDGGATADADAGDDGGATTDAGEDATGVEGGADAADAAEVDSSSTSVVDSGTAVDSGEGGVAPGNVGIALVSTTNDPTKYLLNASAGMTVTGESTASYTIKGLKNCTNYLFVISAVDGYGNVGPPSSATCAWPESAGDFWQSYRGDGGQAGGYCALETVGRSPHSLAALALLVGGVVVAASRRRRRAR